MDKKIGCVFSKDRIPFDMPDEIISACLNNKLVIFAGAGISTENKLVFPYTLYEDILSKLNIKDKTIEFPNLMSKFCTQPDGRKKLLNIIKERFDYIESFPRILSLATTFHQELSDIFYIKNIITTNWDDYFEKKCAAIPLVTPEDFAFWDNPNRKVFKIHGSINNYGTIIATKEDYDKCYKRLSKGILGGSLKQILATKTILFIGYSFRDSDFNKINDFIKKELGELIPHSYLITLDKNKKSNSSLTVINTDGSFFISSLRNKLIEMNKMFSDDYYHFIYPTYNKVINAHLDDISSLDIKKNPSIIYTMCYQDGVIHALERFFSKRKTGEYSVEENIIKVIDSYSNLRKEKLKFKKYTDVAYIDGYTSFLSYFLKKSLNKIPLYYIYGCEEDICDFKKYKEYIDRKKIFHKDSYLKAVAIVQKHKKGIVFEHSPFLL